MKKKYINKVDRAFFKLDRENAWRGQDKRCYYCNRTLARHEITADHVIPLKHTSGYHTAKNIVAACEKCNSDKGCKLDFSPKQSTENDQLFQDVFDRLEERTKLAEYRLSFNQKGSFAKWKKYHEKKGRWDN